MTASGTRVSITAWPSAATHQVCAVRAVSVVASTRARRLKRLHEIADVAERHRVGAIARIFPEQAIEPCRQDHAERQIVGVRLPSEQAG